VSDAQHDFVVFVLIALMCGAVLGAVVTLSGCGGAEFTGIHNEAKADGAAASEAAPWQEEPVALETSSGGKPDAEAHDGAIRDESSTDVEFRDVAPVEVDAMIDNCDAAACRNVCVSGNTRCCTVNNTCGCSDFGPVCL
jgi:hypothetical protein